MTNTSWLPTKKWWAALVTGLSPILISGIESGFDKAEESMAIALALALLGAYIKRNDPTPEGKPVA